MGRLRKHIPSPFQGKLMFPAARSFALGVEHPLESVVLRSLIVIIFALFISYLYFVGSSVLNIIARKEALTQATQISTVIGTYESQYYAISKDITQSKGIALGLTPVSNAAYVYRFGAVGLAQMPRNEI